MAPPKVGSPPLARDKFIDYFKSEGINGITPACAGQMDILRNCMCCVGDHPRLRGTNGTVPAKTDIIQGSPPLARDKSIRADQICGLTGITPACAGQIFPLYLCKTSHRDHPRLRGTNALSALTPAARQGSPPLARDKFYKNYTIFAKEGSPPLARDKLLLI